NAPSSSASTASHDQTGRPGQTPGPCLFHGDKTLRNEADLFWYLRHRPAPDTSLLVTSSKQGETDFRTTSEFIELAEKKRPTRISSIILDSGGHNFNTWRREIPATLQWMSGRLSDR
ncbi:hypothetical protein ACH3X9_40175, partial [Streptomyces scabiei]